MPILFRIMFLFACLGVAILATGCAAHTDAPALYQQIHKDVNSRIMYQQYAKHDYRYIEPGTRGQGNCAVFASTYAVDVIKAGGMASIELCRLPDGTGHAYALTHDGWVLDNREWHPVKQGENCQ